MFFAGWFKPMLNDSLEVSSDKTSIEQLNTKQVNCNNNDSTQQQDQHQQGQQEQQNPLQLINLHTKNP